MMPGTLAAGSPNSARNVKSLPSLSEFVRFSDPTTENAVVRLTSPASTSLLPAPVNRFVSLRDRFLFFSSDRSGKLQPFRVNLRTGMLTAVAEAANLDARSLCLDQKERILHFIDGGALRAVNVAHRREERPIERDVSAFSIGSVPSEFWVIRNSQLEYLTAGNARVLAENVSGYCLARPGRKGCVFTRARSSGEREIWYVEADPPRDKPVLLASGRVSDPVWSVHGQSLLLLRDVLRGGIYFSEIHEVIPESVAEKCVAPTSEFAAFAPNGDDSVFVGASRSKAQPNIILLLRAVGRELTLCEHRATHPASVAPVFSPDSRRVYFQSDHQGKPAIYSVNVERLVEPTVAVAA
jgi:oligogalacturonide lyase